MENLKETMRDVLENNILSYWLTKVKDEENGGFYGRVDGNDQVHAEAEKGAMVSRSMPVLQATRRLWISLSRCIMT